MSRNRGSIKCEFCPYGGVLEPCEPVRLVSTADTGPHYYSEYNGMEVANSECPWCGGKYLLWFTPPRRWSNLGHMRARFDEDTGKPIPFDSSFRASFNDEPAKADLPTVTSLILRRDDEKEIVIWRRDETWHWRLWQEIEDNKAGREP